MRHVLQYLAHGWRLVSDLHTAIWLYGLIPTAVAGFFAWAMSSIGQSWPIAGAIGVVIFAAVFLVVLGFLGYRAEMKESRTVTLGVVARAHLFIPGRTFIPLHEAARMAYEQTRGTIVAGFAESAVGTKKRMPDDILDWYANSISTKFPIYGKRPPSTMQELIPQELIPQTSFVGGARGLKYYVQTEPTFIDLMMKRRDLRSYLRETMESIKNYPSLSK
jgi:hypothetical protein